MLTTMHYLIFCIHQVPLVEPRGLELSSTGGTQKSGAQFHELHWWNSEVEDSVPRVPLVELRGLGLSSTSSTGGIQMSGAPYDASKVWKLRSLELSSMSSTGGI